MIDVLDIEAAAAEYDYDHFGLRILDDLPEDGEILPPSRRWDDGVPTDEILPGVLATWEQTCADTMELYDEGRTDEATRVAEAAQRQCRPHVWGPWRGMNASTRSCRRCGYTIHD